MGARLLLVVGREAEARADVFRVTHDSTRSHVGAHLAKWQNNVTMPQASKVNVASGALVGTVACRIGVRVFAHTYLRRTVSSAALGSHCARPLEHQKARCGEKPLKVPGCAKNATNQELRGRTK